MSFKRSSSNKKEKPHMRLNVLGDDDLVRQILQKLTNNASIQPKIPAELENLSENQLKTRDFIQVNSFGTIFFIPIANFKLEDYWGGANNLIEAAKKQEDSDPYSFLLPTRRFYKNGMFVVKCHKCGLFFARHQLTYVESDWEEFRFPGGWEFKLECPQKHVVHEEKWTC